jgi:hypothetical protein
MGRSQSLEEVVAKRYSALPGTEPEAILAQVLGFGVDGNVYYQGG